ncbi:low molecular weight protein-tyrosine-phosphatase [Roseibium aggregatum]|uniref:protein-tyrosine-phosphatase n=1 Tax=Roseibium aggregatum TaxID=187304 RepID=A0A939EKJ2_9HYPH|nr:low molecular weight protein-tyrosine-phosphatase [Roseibium aggregatum]MBN9673404.1 low molecular weight phosphotyrosine protein phosphatase [Roseibium aggregatum]
MTHSVLFVCLGNICRSPLAEGVFRDLVEDAGLVERFLIDSAGTGAWHTGNPPDPRSIEIAATYGIDISRQKARQVRAGDFERFGIILAMDGSNLNTLWARDEVGSADIRLLLDDPPRDVPDPYYGGTDGFEEVYRLLRFGCETLLRRLT